MNEIIAKQKINQLLEEYRSRMTRQPSDRVSFSNAFDAYLFLYGRETMSELVNKMGFDKEQALKIVELSKTAFYDKYFK